MIVLRLYSNVCKAKLNIIIIYKGLPQWLSGKESACNAGDLGSIPELGRSPRSPEEWNGYLLQYSGLENSMDCNPWGCREWDSTEQLSLSLSFFHYFI